ncbi:type II toxin-antitoxin system VapC family toxin [bacterium]|nr:type II toxin-antitoxin system VapC family toxin [bacterium]
MNYLLDTCIISDLIKPKPNKKLVQWLRTINENNQYLSVMTVGEIQKGISRLENNKKKDELQSWLNNELMERFSGQIVPINVEVAHRWGEILAQSEIRGKKLPIIDSLIAATGIVYDMIVVTRNIDDMEQSGVIVLNPWSDL